MLRPRHVARMTLSALLFVYPLFAQTFASPKNYGPFTDSFQLVVGDFNHDGAADFLGVANVNSSTQVYLYLNNGSAAFAAPKAISGTTGAIAVAVGDFNQDGNLDFAFAASSVGICYGDGQGNFSAPVFFNVNGAPDSIVVGDFNTDGKPDIATLSNATKAVNILTNNGNGTFGSYSFTVPLYYSQNNSGYPPDNVSSLVAGDFNGSHIIDLAYLDTCADASCGPGLSRIYDLNNDGNASFVPFLLNDQLSGFSTLASADVDLDGKVDILASSIGNGFDALFVEYSNGNGSFTQVFADNSDGSDGVPQSLVVGDFNNDDIEDIAALVNTDLYGNADYGFDVYTGKGGRNGFNPPSLFKDNTAVSLRGGFASAFINKDGKRDIALDDATGLSVFLNTTSTTVDPCTYYSGPGLHHCLPANNGSGASPVQFLATYKATVQPAQRIEVWDGNTKIFQEYGDLLNTSLPLSKGKHQLTLVGVDATGKYVKTSIITYTVTSSAICAPPPNPGVQICTPQNGSTDSSPVTVSAAATPSSGLTITATRLYVDNNPIYTSNTNELNTAVALSSGSHYLVVVGYENNGAAFTASSTITVK